MTIQYTLKSNFLLSIINGLLMYLESISGFFFGTLDQSEMTLIPIPLAEAGGFKILIYLKKSLTRVDDCQTVFLRLYDLLEE